MLRLALVLVLCGLSGIAQNRLDRKLIGHRIIAVVPLQGAGTFDDPKRPMFAPRTVSADGIIEFTWEATDDGQHAIVEFVARDRAALQPILNDSRLAGRRFEKGRSTKEEIERELKKHKRDFDAVTFVGGRK